MTMKDVLIEFLVVLGHSSRTQWILLVGVAFASATWFLGAWWIDGIRLEGTFTPATEAIQMFLRERYGGVALGILATSGAAAIKTYRKDRRRLFQL